MITLLATALLLVLFLGPLVIRVVLDRRADRAAVVAANVRAALRHTLGGESLVSVQVTANGFGQRGRVLLAAPSGYGDLIEEAWPAVATVVPPDYDLVVRAPRVRSRPLAPARPQLPRAA